MDPTALIPPQADKVGGDTPSPSVLILWADDGSANLGVQALAAGTVALVREVWPHARIDVENHTPGPWPRFVPPASFARAWLGGDRAERRRLGAYDVVVDTGSGDSFSDIYGMRRLFTMACARTSAVRAGATVVMGPQTIGPFESRVGQSVARASLRGTRFLMARDSASVEYSGSVLKRGALLASDVVFAIPAPVVSEERDVVLNVSGLLWYDNPHVDHQAYRRQVLEYCGGALDAGRQVSLLAHVVESDDRDTDVHAIREVAARIGRPELEQIVPADLANVRSAIASARLVVGARMHACLNALSTGVPALPWAYSRKFEIIDQDLGWPYRFDLRHGASVAEETLEVTSQLASDEGRRAVADVQRNAQERLDVFRCCLRGLID